MSYHYLFTDEDRRPLARVRYRIDPDSGSPIIEEMIPAGAVSIGKVETLELQRNAAQLDKDEAESEGCGNDPDEVRAHQSGSKAEYVSPIKWGIRG